MRDSESTRVLTQTPAARGARVTAAVLIALCAGVLFAGVYFARRSGTVPEVYSNDFNVYYYAAREILAGRDPYQNSIGAWTPYVYPPLLAELIIPIALLPLPFAAYVWFVINALSIAAAAWMSAGLAARRRPDLSSLRPQLSIALFAVLMIVRFVFDNFTLGQVNPLVSALVVAHIYSYVRNRKQISMLALVAAISIKLTPAILLAYHLSRLRLRFSAACLALLAAITVASFLPMRSEATNAFGVFFNRTLKNEQGYNLADAGNQSLRGAVARIGDTTNHKTDPDDSHSRSLISGVSLWLSAILLLAAIVSAVRAPNELSAIAPFVCCIVLLSPLSWKAHFVLLILPLASLIALLRDSNRLRRLSIAISLAAVFALFNVTSPRLIGLEAAEWSDAHSLVFGGALLIFLASVADALGRKFGNQRRVCYSGAIKTGSDR